jgi:hypothetical protein
MRLTWLATVMGVALFVSACGSGDTDELESCGPGGTCPQNFQCNPVDNLCYRSGTIPDARPGDAGAAPDTTITGMPPALGNMATVTFTFTSDRAGATFECRVGTAAFAACTTPHMIAPGDGTHTFEVRAVAGGLTDMTPASHMFTIDTMPPVVTITAGPSGTVTETTATFAFLSSEANSTFMCRLDSGAAETCTSGKTYSNLPTGTHTFVVTATDPAGNTGAPAMRVFTIEAQAALDTTITSAPPATTASTMAMFSFTANRDGATFECSLDGASFGACVPGVTFTDLEPGAHTFSVRAVAGGETDSTPATHAWTIDQTGLVAVILSGADGGVSAATVTFTYMASDAEATFECGLDDEFVECSPSGRTFTGLVHGAAHVFSVRAVKDGVTGPAASRPFVVDAKGPVIAIGAPAEGSTVGGNPTLSFTVDEPATLTCLLDGQALESCTSGMTLPLGTGDYLLTINGVDAVGNPGTASVSFSVEVVGPTAAILEPGDGEVVGITGDIVFSVGEGTETVVCTLDGGEVDCAAPSYSFFLPGGEHTFTVQAFDAAGNPGDPASVTFEVDADPPIVTSIVQLPGGTGGTESFTVTLTDRSQVTSVRCRIDGGNFFTCGAQATSTFPVNELSPGEHLLEVFGIDQFGNTGQGALSRNPPTPFARFAFTHVAGPGHLVLIGHDWAGIFVPKTPGEPPPELDELDEVLVNSIGLAPAARDGFARGFEVVVFTHNAGDDEIENTRDVIDAGLDTNDGFPWFNELDDPAALEAALVGADALLILDQNGASWDDSDPLFGIAGEWEPILRAYLEVGGVVVLNDGYFSDGELSETSLVLDSSLIDTGEVTTPFDDFNVVPCNVRDPIVPFFLRLPSFFEDRMVGWLTPDPWITFVVPAFSNEGAKPQQAPVDIATVMHKWFGQATEGPIGITVENIFGPAPGAEVLFHDADGALIDQCFTISNGTAVHHYPGPDGYLTVGTESQSGTSATTFVGVDPLDDLEHFLPTNAITIPPQPIGIVDVVVEAYGGEVEPGDPLLYVFRGGGAQSLAVANADEIADPVSLDIYDANDRFTEDESYTITAEVIGENTGTLYAYAVLHDVTDFDGQDQVMPEWQDANLAVTLRTGTLSTLENVVFGVSQIVGNLQYSEGPVSTRPLIFSSGTAQTQFWADAGEGDLIFTSMVDSVIASFTDADAMLRFSSRTRTGPVSAAAIDLDLSIALIPPIDDIDVTEGDRLTVTYQTAAIPGDLDGGSIRLTWFSDDELHDWTLVFPAGMTTIVGPMTDDRYFPPSDVTPELSFMQLIGKSWVDTYVEFINDLVNQFADEGGVFRVSLAFSFNEEEGKAPATRTLFGIELP